MIEQLLNGVALGVGFAFGSALYGTVAFVLDADRGVRRFERVSVT